MASSMASTSSGGSVLESDTSGMEEAKASTCEWWKSQNKYDIHEKLGEGTFGVVFAATVRATGQPVVIKRIRCHHPGTGVAATALREASILQELDHPNVIRLLSVQQTPERILMLVFERLACDLGDYMYHLNGGVCRKTKQGLLTPLLKNWMHQMLSGLVHCHSHGILHRDMKPQNVLVDLKSKILKLGDFGLARAVTPPIHSHLTPTVVTLWYRCPEILLGAKTYSPAVDVWSLGVMLAEMANGCPLWPHESQIELLLSIFHDLGTPTVSEWPEMVRLPFYHEFPVWAPGRDYIKHIVPTLDPAGIDLLTKMLVCNPRHRISAKQALRHPWLTGVGADVGPAAPAAKEPCAAGAHAFVPSTDGLHPAVSSNHPAPRLRVDTALGHMRDCEDSPARLGSASSCVPEGGSVPSTGPSSGATAGSDSSAPSTGTASLSVQAAALHLQ